MSKVVFYSALLLLCVVSAVAGAQDNSDLVGTIIPQASGSCGMDFSKVDYSLVTNACKGPSYSTNACCPAFRTLACKYKGQVNDFSTACPINFMAFLNYAGKYPEGVFVGRCTSGDRLCDS